MKKIDRFKRRYLVFSEQAYKREEKTLEKKLKKQLGELEKAACHLSGNTLNDSFVLISILSRRCWPLRELYR